MEKVLVVILSQTRAYELCFDSFEKYVLNELQHADLALCVTDRDNRSEDNKFYTAAKYIWSYHEDDDWRGAYDSLISKYGIIPDWDKFLSKKGNWLGGIKDSDNNQTGSGAILLFMRLFLLECLTSNDLIDKYDRFIITRSDFIWTCPHPGLDALDRDFIWIPNGEAYCGVTDRHICVSSEHLIRVLSPLLYLFKEKPELYDKMEDDHADFGWNIESLLYFIYSDQGLSTSIRYFPYIMYLVKDKETQTRWSSGSQSIFHDYYIKYLNEYKSALVWRWLVKDQDDWRAYGKYFTSEVRDFPLNTPLTNTLAAKLFHKIIKRTCNGSLLVRLLCRIKYAFS